MSRKKRLNAKGKRKVIKFIIKACMLLAAVALVVGCVAAIKKKLTKNKAVEASGSIEESVGSVADTSTSEDESLTLDETLSDEEMKAYIDSHEDKYPEKLRNFCETYPQTTRFVYEYPEKVGQEPEIDLSEEVTDGEFPLLIQWDERWGYDAYGDSIIGMAGCGPTCLSMVYIGLTGDTDMNPREMCRFSDEQGYYEEGSGTRWELLSSGAKKLGLQVQEIGLDKDSLKNEVKQGHPVILSMSEGTFTTSGHFIVVTGVEDGKFVINDPNSRENSEKLWKYSEFSDQVKNLWAFSN